MSSKSTNIRAATEEDAPGIASAHEASILGLGPRSYRPEQVAAWAGRITHERYRQAMREGHRFFVAERAGQILGFSSWCAAEITAVYVHPIVARAGVGSLLLAAAEHAALAQGAGELSLSSSLLAVPFYERHGYEPQERFVWMIGQTGVGLEAVKMRKTFCLAGQIG